MAGAVYRTFSAPSGVGAWGGQVSFSSAIGARLGVTGGLEVSGARRPTPLGESTALLASGSAAGHWRAGDDTSACASRAARAVAWSDSRAPRPVRQSRRDRRAPVGRALRRRSSARGRATLMDLGVETGVAVVSATGLANDMAALEVSGAWLALSLSLGLQR